MTRRKKHNWEFGDIFLVNLKDKTYGIIQVIDSMMKNVVYVAITNHKISDLQQIPKLNSKNLISLIAITKEGLDFGEFKTVERQNEIVSRIDFKNEKLSEQGYVGAKIYDYGLVEDFLNAYHKLDYWNDWFNPNYLDEFLIDIKLKPNNLKLKSE
jgi:hypothetical protein